MARWTFTLRLDEDLCRALDDRAYNQPGGRRSRNWAIEQAVRAWLIDGGGAADETRPAEPTGSTSPGTGMSPDTEPGVLDGSATARAASAGGPQGAQPPQPRHLDDEEGRHFHRFEIEIPDTRRHVQGVEFAYFECGCGWKVERKVRRDGKGAAGEKIK